MFVLSAFSIVAALMLIFALYLIIAAYIYRRLSYREWLKPTMAFCIWRWKN